MIKNDRIKKTASGFFREAVTYGIYFYLILIPVDALYYYFRGTLVIKEMIVEAVVKFFVFILIMFIVGYFKFKKENVK